MPNGYGGPHESYEAERIYELEARAKRAELRIRQLAVLFNIPDGGQYINDAIERAVDLGLGSDKELRDKVKGMEE